MSKFDNVPVEEDTKILSRDEKKIDNYSVLHEKWFWDGIHAETIVFIADDVKDIDGEALKALVAESLLLEDKKMTIKRDSKGFTFVNFNFTYD